MPSPHMAMRMPVIMTALQSRSDQGNRLTLKRKTSVCTPSKVQLMTTIAYMP